MYKPDTSTTSLPLPLGFRICTVAHQNGIAQTISDENPKWHNPKPTKDRVQTSTGTLVHNINGMEKPTNNQPAPALYKQPNILARWPKIAVGSRESLTGLPYASRRNFLFFYFYFFKKLIIFWLWDQTFQVFYKQTTIFLESLNTRLTTSTMVVVVSQKSTWANPSVTIYFHVYI